MNIRSSILLILFVVFDCGIAFSDIYKYIDENGVVHFTNSPPTREYKLYRRESFGGGASHDINTAFATSYKDLVRHYSSRYSLEEGLIHAVIKAESNYNPTAVSRKGALGLMQLMPETAKLLNVSNPFDAEENIRGGSSYLRQMLDTFNGNIDYAIAAYNAGPNAVKRHGGIPPYEETQTYVKRVKQYLRSYRQQGTWL